MKAEQKGFWDFFSGITVDDLRIQQFDKLYKNASYAHTKVSRDFQKLMHTLSNILEQFFEIIIMIEVRYGF